MHRLEISILDQFRHNPTKSFTTSELVKEVFKEEYRRVNQQLRSSDRREKRLGRTEKGALHRKLLYHLNKLVDQQLIQVSGIKGKGEKLFCLAIDEGELIIQGGERKIIISKPGSIATPIDGYVRDGVMRKFKPGTWLNKHDAILLDCGRFASTEELQQRIQHLLPTISDVLALHKAERLFKRRQEEEVRDLLYHLALDARDYDVQLSLLIDLHHVEDEKALTRCLASLLPALPAIISFTFTTSPRYHARKEEVITTLFTLFSSAKQKLTLQNNDVFEPPLFHGRAGPYVITREDWRYYQEHVRPRADGCIVGQTNLIINVHKFFASGGTYASFREMISKACHAFFSIEEQRRRHSAEYFDVLALQSLDATKEFFKVGRDYLRFWNYDLEAANSLPELLESVKEGTTRFSARQEVIFKSCGLPIRFRIGLSSAFPKGDPDFFTERHYRKSLLASLKDLQSRELRSYLAVRERLYAIFDGADRLRLFMAPRASREELKRMSRYLLSAYSLPSFTFDFKGKSGELKLTAFLEEMGEE